MTTRQTIGVAVCVLAVVAFFGMIAAVSGWLVMLGVIASFVAIVGFAGLITWLFTSDAGQKSDRRRE